MWICYNVFIKWNWCAYHISRNTGQSNIWWFSQKILYWQDFKLVVLSTVWKEAHVCSINGSINGIHLIWWLLWDLPNRLIKITVKQTTYKVCTYLVSQYSSHHKAYEGTSHVLCLALIHMYLLHKHADQLEIIIKKIYSLNALGTL